MTNAPPTSAAHAGILDLGGDLTVHRLGYGAMRITGDGIWGEPPDRDGAKATLRRCHRTRRQLHRHRRLVRSRGQRDADRRDAAPLPDDLVIATKGGLERTGPGRWPTNGRPEHLRAACEGSLQRLRLDQIPLYQFHRPDPDVPLEDSIGALVELKNEGKIRHIGVCNVTEAQLRRVQHVTPVVSVQNRYNVTDRTSESLVDLCEQERSGVPAVGADPRSRRHPGRDRNRRPSRCDRPPGRPRLVARRSPAMLPIPGTSSVAHLESNLTATGVDLALDEVAAITQQQPTT